MPKYLVNQNYFTLRIVKLIQLSRTLDAMKNYKPIACSFHDVLLHHATLKDEVELVFYVDKVQETVKTRIIDVLTKAGEEFLIISDGSSIRLDHIVSINDQYLSHHC